MAAPTGFTVVEADIESCCSSLLDAPLGVAEADELAVGFTALADPVRLRLLSILAAAPTGEVCVCDFVAPLGKSQPTVPHHLKILSEAGLVHATNAANGSGIASIVNASKHSAQHCAAGSDPTPVSAAGRFHCARRCRVW